MTTDESGAQPREYTAKYAADRVRNASAVWLGSTLGCAECHDHKHDPFTQRDFYRFAAFFADVKEAAVGPITTGILPPAPQAAAHELLRGQIVALRTQLATTTPELEAAQPAWERAVTRWFLLKPASVAIRHGKVAVSKLTADARILPTDATKNSLTFVLTAPVSNLSAIRLELTPMMEVPKDGEIPSGGPNVVLTQVDLSAGGKTVRWREFVAANYRSGKVEGQSVAGFPKGGWEVKRVVKGRASFAILQPQQPVSVPPGTALTLRLHYAEGSLFRLGQVRVAFNGDAQPPAIADSVPAPGSVSVLLAQASDQRTLEQRAIISAHFRQVSPLLDSLREQLAGVLKELAAIEAGSSRILMSESVAPRPVRVLPRGDWMNETGDLMQPAVPASLGAVARATGRETRLDLAHWLTRAENPLVARVFVNRLWYLLFGRGLVSTLEDFGSRGALPTHPELLDWLAAEFIASGWDVKHTVRQIVLSDAYRRTSQETPELRLRDPHNSLLARQGRFRLDAEMVRDAALAIGGLLDASLGGASARPYQPAGYWDNLIYGFEQPPWKSDLGAGQYRRGLYTFWRRAALHPSLLAFDAPPREECVSQRSRSNTPQQALVLLNDPSYLEAARALAGRLLSEGGGTTEARIQFAFRAALARDARPPEISVLALLVREQTRVYAADPAAAALLSRVGDQPAPRGVDPVDLAAWTSVARAVLNLHETITRN